MNEIKILCAEDDRLTRLEIKEKLETMGWEVIEAVDGVEAFEKYKSCNPDLIVLDVDMPKRNGLEVLQLIRVNDLQTPVVIYSSLAKEEDLLSGFSYGAKAYLIKSYSVDLLLLQLNNLVNELNIMNVRLAEGVVYYFSEAELRIGERCEKLSMLESKVFAVLCKNKNKLARRELLLQAGWNKEDPSCELQLNKVIRRLRQLLEGVEGVEIVVNKGNGYWLRTKKDKG